MVVNGEFYKIVNEVLFYSKIIGLKINLFEFNNDKSKENKIDLTQNLENIINLSEVLYLIKVNFLNKSIIIIAFDSNINIEFNEFFFYKIEKKLDSYKIIYDYLKTNLNYEIAENNIIILWKNQFLVSSVLDFYSGGLVLAIPKNWKSYNVDRQKEIKINYEIFNLTNNWLKSKKINSLEQLFIFKEKELLS